MHKPPADEVVASFGRPARIAPHLTALIAAREVHEGGAARDVSEGAASVGTSSTATSASPTTTYASSSPAYASSSPAYAPSSPAFAASGVAAATLAVVWDGAARRDAAAFARRRCIPLFAAVDGPLAGVGRDRRSPSLSALFVPLADEGSADPRGPFEPWSPAFADAIGAGIRDLLAPRGIAATAHETAAAAIAAMRIEGLRHVTPVIRRGEPWHEADWRIVVAGGASGDPTAFHREREALAAALASVAAERVLVVCADPVRGALAEAARAAGARCVAAHEVPAALLAAAGEVWDTAGGPLGWDALVHGAPVRLLGPAFYAGFGLAREPVAGHAGEPQLCAEDASGASAGHADGIGAGAPPASATAVSDGSRVAAAPDTKEVRLEAVFAAVALGFTNYADPVSRRPIGIMDAIDRLASWRDRLAARPARVVCVRFDHWKWPIARGFFGDGSGNVAFSSAARAPAAARRTGATVYVWGSSAVEKVRRKMAADGGPPVPVAQIEDGFIRSVGLGSDFRWPASYAIDDVGIYYDARSPSRLEQILSEADFDAATLERARRLRALIRERKISKYNIDAAHGKTPLPELPAGRRRILVVGQVPTDASLAHGLAMFGGDNLPFLAAVRRAEPDALVIYKEHPELVRRNRPGWLTAAEVRPYADLFLRSGDTTQVLGAVDHVHTMTSLAGFEALLHGRPVTCWGAPFYAGWGLTEDKVAIPRRSRRRTIEEVVAAALIAYPIYVDPETQIPCEVEDIVSRIGTAEPALTSTDSAGRATDGWPLATRSRAGLMRLRVLAFTYLEHPLVLARRRRLVRRAGLR